MRKALLFIASLGMTGWMWAGDPVLGTWKLNISRSKIAPETESPVCEQLLVVRETGDQWEISIKGKREDGSFFSMKGTKPKTAGMVKMSNPEPHRDAKETAINTVVDAGNWYFTILQSGNQVNVTEGLVSRDGGTLMRISDPPSALDSEKLSLEQQQMGPGRWRTTYLENGDQTGVIENVISKDGRTLTQTQKGLQNGRPYEFIYVYEKQ